MEKSSKIILVTTVVIAISALILLSTINTKKTPKKVLLVGGLDNRPNDKSLSDQKALLQKSNSDAEVTAIRYNDFPAAKKALLENSFDSVILFSAGCKYSDQIAEILRSKNESLSKLFIVEPYHSGGKTSRSVKTAVDLGVPAKNVFVGKTAATGNGIVANASDTPKCSPSHWCALTEIGKLV